MEEEERDGEGPDVMELHENKHSEQRHGRFSICFVTAVENPPL